MRMKGWSWRVDHEVMDTRAFFLFMDNFFSRFVGIFWMGIYSGLLLQERMNEWVDRCKGLITTMRTENTVFATNATFQL